VAVANVLPLEAAHVATYFWFCTYMLHRHLLVCATVCCCHHKHCKLMDGGQNTGHILAICTEKVHEIFGECRGCFAVCNVTFDYLYHILFWKFTIKLQSRWKPFKIVLDSQFLGKETPNFGCAFTNLAHFPSCGKVWLSSIWWALRVAGDKKKEKEFNKRGKCKAFRGRPNKITKKCKDLKL